MRWLIVVALAACSGARESPRLSTKEALGAALFDDPRLSEPAGQACSDCHTAGAAFADPEDERTSAGVHRDRFGSRNAQSAMYARFVPPLHREGDRMVGGLFWDGRANTLEEQAAVPFLNPLEMNNPDKATVVAKVRKHYGRDFRAVFGADTFDDVERAYTRITEAIAAFERMQQFAPFSSKYDRYLAGTAQLDERELRGLQIFEDPARGNCASCHPSRPGRDGSPPLFTNFAYANLGLPRFADNPFYSLPASLNPDGTSFIDRGLGQTTKDPRHDGMFRVPSLRNVARTTPYGHNGYFRRLDEMIQFLHAPDPRTPPAEVPHTVDRSGLAGITLTRQDVDDLVAFLATLTDAGVEGAR